MIPASDHTGRLLRPSRRKRDRFLFRLDLTSSRCIHGWNQTLLSSLPCYFRIARPRGESCSIPFIPRVLSPSMRERERERGREEPVVKETFVLFIVTRKCARYTQIKFAPGAWFARELHRRRCWAFYNPSQRGMHWVAAGFFPPILSSFFPSIFRENANAVFTFGSANRRMNGVLGCNSRYALEQEKFQGKSEIIRTRDEQRTDVML